MAQHTERGSAQQLAKETKASNMGTAESQRTSGAQLVGKPARGGAELCQAGPESEAGGCWENERQGEALGWPWAVPSGNHNPHTERDRHTAKWASDCSFFFLFLKMYLLI